MTLAQERTVTFEAPTEGEWDRLDQVGGLTQIFQSRPWVDAWLVHLGRGTEPAFVSVRRSGVLRAMAPMVVARDGDRDGQVRLRFAGTDLNDYNAVLGAAGEASAIVEALLNAFGVPVVLECIRPRTVLARMASSTSPSWESTPSPPMPCPTAEMRDRAIEPPSRRVREWSRILGRLSATDAVSLDLVQGTEAVEAFAPVFAARRLESWTARKRHHELLATQRDPAFPDFLGDALGGLAERKQAFFVNLCHDGALLASDLWLRRGSEALLYMRHFDPAAARVQPGLILLWQSIMMLRSDDVRCVHFGRGDEPYKRMFGAGNEVVLTTVCRPRDDWSPAR